MNHRSYNQAATVNAIQGEHYASTAAMYFPPIPTRKSHHPAKENNKGEIRRSHLGLTACCRWAEPA
jgi:hypothetical protein